MKEYKDLLIKNDLEVDKVTIIGKTTIITTPVGQFVIKKNNNINIYNYLLSRGFDYFPKIIDYNDKYILFEYIDSIKYDDNERALDFIKLLALLHSKTSYYIEVSNYEMKSIQDNLINKVNDLINYYNNIINIIESKEYMSPSEYLLIRNISIINSNLNYVLSSIKRFFDGNLNKKRVSTLYNNININKLLKSKDNSYLTDFSNTSVESPVYDLYSFYKNYSLNFDFYSLYKTYNKINRLTDIEKDYLLILISIPDKILLSNNIYDISIIKYSINKIYNTLSILNSEKEEGRKTHETKDNEK